MYELSYSRLVPARSPVSENPPLNMSPNFAVRIPVFLFYSFFVEFTV